MSILVQSQYQLSRDQLIKCQLITRLQLHNQIDSKLSICFDLLSNNAPNTKKNFNTFCGSNYSPKFGLNSKPAHLFSFAEKYFRSF